MDYLAGAPEAAHFFSGHPNDLHSFRAKLDEVTRRFGRAEREAAAAAVHPTSDSARERLARFVEEGGAMVTTGQQTGLFTGPLYTIHKILTAIRLAEALERELGTIVLPVFWCASEDHDFAEANHTFAVDADGALSRFAVAATDARPVPMSEMRLGKDVESVSAEYGELVAALGGTDVDLTRFSGPYRTGETVAGAFRGMVERLFANFDLLVTDAADPALKQISVPVLRAAVAEASQHERLLSQRTEALEAAGYAPQVTLVADAANVFHHGPAGRERLVRAGWGWAAPEARLRMTPEEVDARIVADPGSFSPNVLLRPVLESAVFPTLAYVGGPAEVAYFAQINPLFGAMGMLPPIAYPRFSARLVPDHVAEAAEELGLTDAELALPEHELVSLVARRRLAPEIAERLSALRTAIVDGFGAVMDASAGVDANLELAIGARRDRALLAAADAERKILAHAKRADRGITHLLPLVRNTLMPFAAPQERSLNLLPFLAMRPTLLHDLAQRMEIRLGADAAHPEKMPDGAVHAPAPTAIR